MTTKSVGAYIVTVTRDSNTFHRYQVTRTGEQNKVLAFGYKPTPEECISLGTQWAEKN